LVIPDIVQELPGEVYLATLHLAINRQGVVFLWPTRGLGPDGRDNDYWRTAREAAGMARVGWIKMKANQSLRAYEIFEPENRNIPELDWPAEPLEEIVRTGFPTGWSIAATIR
jgi:hypothetical protein